MKGLCTLSIGGIGLQGRLKFPFEALGEHVIVQCDGFVY